MKIGNISPTVKTLHGMCILEMTNIVMTLVSLIKVQLLL